MNSPIQSWGKVIFEFKIPILTKSHIKQQWTQFKTEQKKKKKNKKTKKQKQKNKIEQNNETNIIKTQLWGFETI